MKYLLTTLTLVFFLLSLSAQSAYVCTKNTYRYVRPTDASADYDTVAVGVLAHAETKQLLSGLYDFEIINPDALQGHELIAMSANNAENAAKNAVKEAIARHWDLSTLKDCDLNDPDCHNMDWVELPLTASRSGGGIAGKDATVARSVSGVAQLQIAIHQNGQREVIPVEYQYFKKVVKTREGAAAEALAQERVQVEVICDYEERGFLIGHVQLALKRYNYYTGPINGYWTTYTEQALESFQKERFLPVGELDRMTLEQLGLDFDTLAQRGK